MIRQKISDEIILDKEKILNEYIYNELKNVSNLFILGSRCQVEKIPIFSFVIKFSGKIFHFNFVSSLLNDLFGIQSRGGCSCASTYGQKCLGLNENYLEKLEKIVCNGKEIFRPGYTRINFPYFYEKHVVDYILKALKFVAEYGYLFLSHYAFKIESGDYYHRSEEDEKRKWLNQIDFIDGNIKIPDLIEENIPQISAKDLDDMMNKSYEILKDMKNITKHTLGKSKINHKILFDDSEQFRWFLVPDDLDHLNLNENLENIIDNQKSDKKFLNLINKEINKPLEIKFNFEKYYEDKIKEIETIEKTNDVLPRKKEDLFDMSEFINLENQSDFKINKKNVDLNLYPE